ADLQAGALGGGEHHELHDALAIHALVAFLDADIAGEAVGGVDERHRGSGVEAEPVLDDDVSGGCGHGGARGGNEAATILRGCRTVAVGQPTRFRTDHASCCESASCSRSTTASRVVDWRRNRRKVSFW